MGPNDPQWNQQTSTQGSTVSSNNVSGTQVGNVDPYYSSLYNETPEVRKQISQALKSAGYKVKVSGAFSDALAEAYSNANTAAQLRAGKLGKPINVKDGAARQQAFNDYIVQESAARLAEGPSGASAVPMSRREIRLTDPTTAAGLIHTVMNDLVGRGPTKDELKKYTSALQKAQENAPVTVDYANRGVRASYTTTGGLNEQQFLIDQIAGSDEAQANKVMGFYDVFKQAIGVQ